MKDTHHLFSWTNLAHLMGLPYSDQQVQQLFTKANLRSDELLQELRVGIDSMPPRNAEPASVMEINLTSSFDVRLRFKQAKLVQGAKADRSDTFVFAALTYFLNEQNATEGYQEYLPAGIQYHDTPQQIIARMGRSPTHNTLHAEKEYGSISWEDHVEVLHVLFDMATLHIKRINIFLLPADN